MSARKSHFSSSASINSAAGPLIVGNAASALPRLGYTVTEAAKATSLSKSKLWELIRSGELGSVKVSGRRIVRHSDLVALLNREAI